MFNSFPRPVPDNIGGSIKNVQRGSTTLTSGVDAFVNVPIASADVSKSVVIISFRVTSGAPTSGFALYVKGELTSSTILRLERGGAGGVTVAVDWQVIEFGSVKSVQSGILNLSTNSQTVPLPTKVNPNKSLVYFSFLDPAGATLSNLPISANVNSIGDGIVFQQLSTDSKTVRWYVVDSY